MPPVLAEQDVIGSDVENFECPACGCHDRERHLFMYLQASGLLQELSTARILHLAPERHLERLISMQDPLEYVRGDLHPARPGVLRVDLMGIDFPDARFDVLIANHVLEHVDDDSQSLREIWRVLRPGGHAILQTPFSARMPHKLEDASIATGAERLRAYGQEDHCRLYGADFIQFVASFGFEAKVASHETLLDGVNPRLTGVNDREPFLLFLKSGVR